MGRVRQAVWRGACLLIGVVLVLAVGHLILTRVVLPSYLRSLAAQAGLALSFESLASTYGGQLELGAPALRAEAGWSLRAERLEANLDVSSLLGGELLLERAHATGARVAWNGNHLGPSEVRLRFEDLPEGGRSGSASVDGPGARLQLAGRSAQFDLEGRVRLKDWSGAATGLRLGEGAVSASGVSLGPALDGAPKAGGAAAPPEAPSLRASLRWPEAAFSHERGLSMVGELSAAGADAGIWLELAAADATLRWMLSGLSGQPFELTAEVSARGDRWALRELQLETGLTRARGGLFIAAEGPRGAFLVLRGTGAIGILLKGDAIRTRMMPGVEWLPRELEQLARGSE